ncbi:RDD family protein [Rossellomorea vietnamensis]|uniref:RDD family protein n=1 Tax=Rossellomorea vietnamensis TaxID=218284 RepID=A0A5D4KF93_9BACI|nr:RDD family protein [Rossellomorea vietnamensis]TYR75981.1 RDD family protein [Rossellomorea vietnamensis]
MQEEQVDIKTPEYVSLQFQAAGLGSRAAAFLIDQLLLAIINFAVIIGLVLFMDLQSSYIYFFEESPISSGAIAITVIVLFVINWGYFFAYEFFSGGKTLGKSIIGIRVIQDNGQSITLLSSFIRNLLRIIDMLPFYYIVGMLMIFFHGKHKRLGDLTAGTVVVHERKKKSKRKTGIEKVIASRGLSRNSVTFEEGSLKPLQAKEWKLLKTYTQRFTGVEQNQRLVLTKQVAEIILPKIGMEIERQTEEELENILLVIYLNMKDEWEFEL